MHDFASGFVADVAFGGKLPTSKHSRAGVPSCTQRRAPTDVGCLALTTAETELDDSPDGSGSDGDSIDLDRVRSQFSAIRSQLQGSRERRTWVSVVLAFEAHLNTELALCCIGPVLRARCDFCC